MHAHIPNSYNEKIEIPYEKSKKFVILAHEHLSHPGIEKLYYSLLPTYNIKKLKSIITEITLKCHQCNVTKKYTKKLILQEGEICRYEINETLGVDIFGPITLTNKHDNKQRYYFVVMIDLFSRYVLIDYVTSITSKDIWNVICNKWIKNNGNTKRNIVR